MRGGPGPHLGIFCGQRCRGGSIELFAHHSHLSCCRLEGAPRPEGILKMKPTRDSFVDHSLRGWRPPPRGTRAAPAPLWRSPLLLHSEGPFRHPHSVRMIRRMELENQMQNYLTEYSWSKVNLKVHCIQCYFLLSFKWLLLSNYLLLWDPLLWPNLVGRGPNTCRMMLSVKWNKQWRPCSSSALLRQSVDFCSLLAVKWTECILQTIAGFYTDQMPIHSGVVSLFSIFSTIHSFNVMFV